MSALRGQVYDIMDYLWNLDEDIRFQSIDSILHCMHDAGYLEGQPVDEIRKHVAAWLINY